jgi:MFS family permease
MATFVAVPYQLYALTGSALQVGLLSICDAVPLLAFAAVGATVADRFDRRKIVLWTDLGLMAVAALLAVNAFAGSPQVWALYVLAACATSLWSLGAPALRAMMPGLVPEDQLAASQALQSIYSQTAAIAGPARVASTPALGNVEAGIVASLTSLRFSVVSGGIASAAGAVAIVALLPGLFRYDGSGHGRGLTPTATEP